VSNTIFTVKVKSIYNKVVSLYGKNIPIKIFLFEFNNTTLVIWFDYFIENAPIGIKFILLHDKKKKKLIL